MASRERGAAALIVTLSILVILLVIGLSVAIDVILEQRESRNRILSLKSYYIAESAIDDYILRLNRGETPSDTRIFSSTLFSNAGTAELTWTQDGDDPGIQILTARAEAQARARELEARMRESTDLIHFNYAMQVGYGGLEMGRNAAINGNVYANSSIGRIPGGERGQDITGSVMIAGASDEAVGTQNLDTSLEFPARDDASRRDLMQSFAVPAGGISRRISLYVRKVDKGSGEDIPIRIAPDVDGAPGTQDIANGKLKRSLVGTTAGWVDVTFDNSPSPIAQLAPGVTYWIIFDADSFSPTRYYVFSGGPDTSYPDGSAFYSKNYRNEPLTPAGGDIAFKIWAGSVETGLKKVDVGGDLHAHFVEDTTVGGSVFATSAEEATIGGNLETDSFEDGTVGGNAQANSLKDCTIGGNATYLTIQNCTVGGTSYPGTPVTPPTDPPVAPLPISDSNIASWKADAEAGGTCAPPVCDSAGDLIMDSGETMSLGPMKIDGDLHVENNSTLVITGTLYVTGDMRTDLNGTVRLDSGYGAAGGIVIADGEIDFRHTTQAAGSGDPNSFIMFLSASDSIDGGAPAIRLRQGSTGVIFYAHNGLIRIGTGVTVQAIIGHQVRIHENASVDYVSGLKDVLFSNGPGGRFRILQWREK